MAFMDKSMYDITPSYHSANPYLNFDPSYVNTSPESQYIFPEGASRNRGRFELAFSQIGGSVVVGAGAGGVNGLYKGLQFTTAEKLQGAIWRTQMLNFITKHGASSAQSFGVLALMYSAFGVVLSKARGADDELNTLASGFLTGLAYKSSAGWKRCLRSGGIGVGLAAAYVMITSRDRVKEMMHQLKS